MTLCWGIISAGKISHDFVTALATLPAEEHKVVAVAAQDLSRAKTFSKFHNIEKAYSTYLELAQDKDIEVVYIGNLNTQHFDVAKLMLNHSKHVLCEKPLTMNIKQTMELLNLAKEKKLFLMEAIWSRCFPIYDIVKNEIQSNGIGEVYQVLVSFGFRMPHVERLKYNHAHKLLVAEIYKITLYSRKCLGGGTILDLGIYGIQLACLIFNNEVPSSVHAAGCLNKEGVDQSISATFIYEGNRTATIVTHALVDLPNEAYIIGTKGTIKLSNFWCPTTVQLPNRKIHVPLPETKHTTNFINSAGLRYEAAEVRDCIRKGLLESSKVPHAASVRIAQLEDELRKQLGVTFPEDV